MKTIIIFFVALFGTFLISYGSDHSDTYSASNGTSYHTGLYNNQQGWTLPTGYQAINPSVKGFVWGIEASANSAGYIDADVAQASTKVDIKFAGSSIISGPIYNTEYNGSYINLNNSIGTYGDQYYINIITNTLHAGQTAFATAYVNW